MTILSKEALEKITEERAACKEEEAEDIEALFKQIDKTQEKEADEEYNPFAEGEFESFKPDNE
ncbi:MULTISPECIES: hypothetical protein [unclassified Legionella]|uniref:hypothetical protein n=1 Tax=unclassified Legionella TaxID=2622702 RepID=UPI001055AAD6|nr:MULTISPECIES: hypothetical protein [unclassified Legionella]MDI9817981.1 hypothetical protein [Legionella sp. PL877]